MNWTDYNTSTVEISQSLLIWYLYEFSLASIAGTQTYRGWHVSLSAAGWGFLGRYRGLVDSIKPFRSHTHTYTYTAVSLSAQGANKIYPASWYSDKPLSIPGGTGRQTAVVAPSPRVCWPFSISCITITAYLTWSSSDCPESLIFFFLINWLASNTRRSIVVNGEWVRGLRLQITYKTDRVTRPTTVRRFVSIGGPSFSDDHRQSLLYSRSPVPNLLARGRVDRESGSRVPRTARTERDPTWRFRECPIRVSSSMFGCTCTTAVVVMDVPGTWTYYALTAACVRIVVHTEF